MGGIKSVNIIGEKLALLGYESHIMYTHYFLFVLNFFN